MAWTDERIERAKQLWLDGKSAGQIAQDLGGVSRNAVIGKLNRLGFTAFSGGRSMPARGPKQPSPPKAPAVRRVANPLGNKARMPVQLVAPPVVVVAVRVPPRPDLAKPWEDRRRGECAWPIDGPDGAAWSCCAPAPDDKPIAYCADHHQLAFVPRKQPVKEYVKSLRRFG